MSRTLAGTLTAMMLVTSCADSGNPRESGPFESHEPDGVRGITIDPGQTAVIGSATLEARGGESVEILSVSAAGQGMNSEVASEVDFRLYPIGKNGLIGAYVEGATDLPSGGWPLRPASGSRVSAEDGRVGLVLLVTAKGEGAWRSDYADVEYRTADAGVASQRIKASVGVCVGSPCDPGKPPWLQ